MNPKKIKNLPHEPVKKWKAHILVEAELNDVDMACLRRNPPTAVRRPDDPFDALRLVKNKIEPITKKDMAMYIDCKNVKDARNVINYLGQLNSYRTKCQQDDNWRTLMDLHGKVLGRRTQSLSLWTLFVEVNKYLSLRQLGRILSFVESGLAVVNANATWSALITANNPGGLLQQFRERYNGEDKPVEMLTLAENATYHLNQRQGKRKASKLVLSSPEMEAFLQEKGIVPVVRSQVLTAGPSSASRRTRQAEEESLVDVEAEETRPTRRRLREAVVEGESEDGDEDEEQPGPGNPYFAALLPRCMFQTETKRKLLAFKDDHHQRVWDKPPQGEDHIREIFIGADLPYFSTTQDWDQESFVGVKPSRIGEKFVKIVCELMAGSAGMLVVFGNMHHQLQDIYDRFVQKKNDNQGVREITYLFVNRKSYNSKTLLQPDRCALTNNVEVALQVIFGRPRIDYSQTPLKHRKNMLSVPWEHRVKNDQGQTVNTAQKPRCLWTWFLSSMKPDIVYDLFAGTGSLSVAAAMQTLPFVAVEKHARCVSWLCRRFETILTSSREQQIRFKTDQDTLIRHLDGTVFVEEARTDDENESEVELEETFMAHEENVATHQRQSVDAGNESVPTSRPAATREPSSSAMSEQSSRRPANAAGTSVLAAGEGRPRSLKRKDVPCLSSAVPAAGEGRAGTSKVPRNVEIEESNMDVDSVHQSQTRYAPSTSLTSIGVSSGPGVSRPPVHPSSSSSSVVSVSGSSQSSSSRRRPASTGSVDISANRKSLAERQAEIRAGKAPATVNGTESGAVVRKRYSSSVSNEPEGNDSGASTVTASDRGGSGGTGERQCMAKTNASLSADVGRVGGQTQTGTSASSRAAGSSRSVSASGSRSGSGSGGGSESNASAKRKLSIQQHNSPKKTKQNHQEESASSRTGVFSSNVPRHTKKH